ncbi:MAG: hypothetical protein NDI90_02860 [Nitrospira sp. BO4]|nr:hypothetical protein [Nitrospira sp. BO4]
MFLFQTLLPSFKHYSQVSYFLTANTTRIRGLIAIHAAKEFDQAAYNWLRVHRPELPLTSPADCPHGGIIGSVNLVDCVSSHSSLWFSGPYGFVLERPQPCPFIPLKGRLGFFPIS